MLSLGVMLSWAAIGSTAAAVGSVLTLRRCRPGCAVNVGVGIAGAALGGQFLPQLLGRSGAAPDLLSVSALLAALLGAVIALDLFHLIRRTGLI